MNLYLHVVGRRSDGYHLLDSLAVFPAIGDSILVRTAPALSLRIHGPFGAGLDGGAANLVSQAARALASAAGVGCRAAITLTKTLPVASGIGGGSADAAATLRALARLWGVSLSPDALMAVAARIGADVPVCLHSRPARMEGVGEVLSPAPLIPSCGMVLVNPRVAVSTPAVFAARAGGFSDPARLPVAWPSAAAMADDVRLLRNDLEAPAAQLCPAIVAVLAWLADRPGCLLARMSGSGATCYGLFADPAMAARAAVGAPPGWWAWGGAAGG